MKYYIGYHCMSYQCTLEVSSTPCHDFGTNPQKHGAALAGLG